MALTARRFAPWPNAIRCPVTACPCLWADRRRWTLSSCRKCGFFLDHYNVPLYSEHLSYCSDDGHLYDLLPLPFTEEAVHHVAARIRQSQDILGRRLAVENVSYYAAPQQDMDELTFTNAVLREADCDLLLDVNNVYVNSINHGFDPQTFLAGIDAGRVVAMHVAGHFDESDTLKIDTHGASVKPVVWSLLAEAYARFGVQPTLLERDFNFPEFFRLGERVTDHSPPAR